MTTDDTVRDNPARLRTYRVRLWWPATDRYRYSRIDAVDAWDANAIIRLNHPNCEPFAFEAWNGERHQRELDAQIERDRAERKAELAAQLAAATSDNPVVPTEGAEMEGPAG